MLWGGLASACAAEKRESLQPVFLVLLAMGRWVSQAAAKIEPSRHYSPITMPQRPQNSGRRPTSNQGQGRFGQPKRSSRDEEEKAVEVDGEISAVLAGTMFRVRLESGHEVLAHISGKMRKRFIRLVVGDKVKMEMSPYDLTKARIVFRVG